MPYYIYDDNGQRKPKMPNTYTSSANKRKMCDEIIFTHPSPSPIRIYINIMESHKNNNTHRCDNKISNSMWNVTISMVFSLLFYVLFLHMLSFKHVQSPYTVKSTAHNIIVHSSNERTIVVVVLSVIHITRLHCMTLCL